MRIGILGGTFNPIHKAHVRLAELAKEKFKLDKVIFMPTYFPPHKKEPDTASPQLRYEMVQLAIDGKSGFEVSDIEIKKRGTSYSVDTLKVLKKKFGPDTDLFFITGSDSLGELSTWKDIDEIFKLSRFIIANRPGFPLKNVPVEAEILKISDMDISSSDIRKKIKEGEGISDIVPERVVSYIRGKRLYK